MHQQTIERAGACAIAARRVGRPITVLTLQERRVIVLLREACQGEPKAASQAAGDLACSLARLAGAMRDSGLILFGPRSRFVSDDELAILSWLSMLQRPSQSARWRMANPLQQALNAFAEALLGMERRLPARSMLADARLERQDCFPIELRSDVLLEASSTNRVQPDAESAAARAVALVERHRFATASQFRELGISTQKLSRLCRRGYVERVSVGLYKKPGAAEAMFAS